MALARSTRSSLVAFAPSPDSYWYGIHTVETLFAVKVTPKKGKQFLERGVQAAVEYLRSRLDLVERLNTDPAN